MAANLNMQEMGGAKHRIIGLDVLRITLAFLIFLFHSKIHLKIDFGILNGIIGNGHIIAMTAFFMLSGYSLYISNGKKDFGKSSNLTYFYKKRFISIYPVYLFASIFGVMMMIISGSQTILDNIYLAPIELLCLQSFYETLFPYAQNGGTWFISCLVFCYFLFPLLIQLVGKMSRNGRIYLVLFLILLLSYAPFIVGHFNTANLYTNPFFRMLEFLVGILLASINEDVFSKPSLTSLGEWFFLIITILIMFVGIGLCESVGAYKYWLPICCFSIILLLVGRSNLLMSRNNTIILYLSGISYAFYLGQIFVWYPMKVLVRHIWHNPNDILLIISSFAACMAASVLLHEFVEKPSGKWLKRALLA